MADYVKIDEFDQGWTFFSKKIAHESGTMVNEGEFPCSKFSCSGCDDWIGCENRNRKVEKYFSSFL